MGVRYGIHPLSKEVSAGGLEPSTNGLKGHCSTIELRAHIGVILTRSAMRVNANLDLSMGVRYHLGKDIRLRNNVYECSTKYRN